MIYAHMEQIHKAYPEFEIHTCELIETGKYNDVLIVNHGYIFRFPRYAAFVEALEHETRLLRWLQERLPLPIPVPVFQKLAPLVPGQVFMGYPRIKGQNLSLKSLQALTGTPAWEEIAAQLGEFLRAMHAIHQEGLDLTLPYRDERKDWEKMYGDVRQLLFDQMSGTARQQVSRHFEEYLDSPHLQQFQFCLRHGDCGPSNIIYDPSGLRVNGVIDFSTVAWGDPAVDLAAISCYGERFLNQILQHYPASEGLLERAAFYRGTFALQEALAGLKYHDRAVYESGMKAYL